MMIAGLTPERDRSVCSAVMNDMIFLGEVGGGCETSENKVCRGVAEDVPRARENVCLIDANPPRAFAGDTGGAVLGGEGGRLECVGDIGGGGMPRGVPAFEPDPFAAAFFLPPNDRRNDHSPSNWMASNSLERGE